MLLAFITAQPVCGFELKDESIPNDEQIRQIPGVLGVSRAGGQYQIIIGPDVPRLYEAVCQTGDFQSQSAIPENFDRKNEKLTIKKADWKSVQLYQRYGE